MAENVHQLPSRFYDAVALLNAGEYFACHEVLEELWREEHTSLRLFYQGVLQVAVGCYHLTRQNRQGGVNKLQQGLAKLRQFPSIMGLVDVRDLCDQVQALLYRIGTAGDEWQGAVREIPLVRVRYLA